MIETVKLDQKFNQYKKNRESPTRRREKRVTDFDLTNFMYSKHNF